MIIYNVTTIVENEIFNSWKKWINTHINDVLKTEQFEKAILSKILTNEEAHTYSVQYFAKNRKSLNEYYKKHAPFLREQAFKTFGQKVIEFTTELEVKEVFHKNQII